jgi:hypothetical protein
VRKRRGKREGNGGMNMMEVHYMKKKKKIA